MRVRSRSIAYRRLLPVAATALLIAVLAFSAIGPRLEPRGGATPTEAAVVTGDKAPVSLLAWFDFPKSDERGGGLSGLAWDSATGTLYAITDDTPRIVPLRPSDDYRTWTPGEPIEVRVADAMWDGEGIAVTEDGFIVSNEFGPKVYELGRDGGGWADLTVPAHFQRILPNRGFEALALSPDGRFLFFANEGPLEGDGPQPNGATGGVVRIVRYDRIARQTAEFAYRTDPIPPPATEGADRGVVEIAALSATDLLVMERSFIPTFGNNVRIYRASVAGAPDVLALANLTERTPAVAKTLLVDLASLPDDGFPEQQQPQPTLLLENFEGMALGPILADGRRVLFLVSDDNRRDVQIPRILVLAVTGL